jgi:N-methylhydantoinase B
MDAAGGVCGMSDQGSQDHGLSVVRWQVMWNRLVALVEEQAQAIMRTAFCTIVRESGDLSAAVFDAEGRVLAQSQTGTPGFLHTLAGVVGHTVDAWPTAAMKPGDAYVTNDPWMCCGHLHDFAVVTPVFKGGRVIAFIASAAHVLDVGGRGLGPDGRSLFEEGLLVPPLPLLSEGRPSDILRAIIRANVRAPDQVIGDIMSLASSNAIAGAKLLRILDESEEDDLQAIGKMIIDQSAAAMRKAVAEIPDGAYDFAIRIDGYDDPVDLVARLTVDGETMNVDFTGTSPASSSGINVVMAYTQAYAWYGLKCILAPDVPMNHGSISNIAITAPANCILNAMPPAPVSARHIIGHMLPDVMFGCLAQVIPTRCPAESGAALWGPQFRGGPGTAGRSTGEDAGRSFEAITVHSGGMGARPGQDGLSVTAFPTNLRTVPVEMIEATTPLVIWRREYRTDSGGAGEFRGGLGQTVEFGHVDGEPFEFSAMFDRVDHPARGRDGGRNGAPGSVSLASGQRLKAKGVQNVAAGERLIFDTPGGSGLGVPELRDPEKVRRDVRHGFVSKEAAGDVYRVRDLGTFEPSSVPGKTEPLAAMPSFDGEM